MLIDGRNFYDQPINDSIRKYDEIRKIATEKGDNYATGCLLDYDYFKKNYQLIVVDLSKQRELDADPRAIQQIEFIRMLKTRSNVFTTFEKSKEAILEFYKGTANLQLSKLKRAVENNDSTTLRINIKIFNKDELPHELLLTTWQSTKLRNAINNNLATDLKLSKAQIKTMIQSGGFLGKLLSKLAGPLMKVAMPLAKNKLTPLGLAAAMSAIDGSIQKKNSWFWC